jgi:hypothetical protein
MKPPGALILILKAEQGIKSVPYKTSFWVFWGNFSDKFTHNLVTCVLQI